MGEDDGITVKELRTVAVTRLTLSKYELPLLHSVPKLQ